MFTLQADVSDLVDDSDVVLQTPRSEYICCSKNSGACPRKRHGTRRCSSRPSFNSVVIPLGTSSITAVAHAAVQSCSWLMIRVDDVVNGGACTGHNLIR